MILRIRGRSRPLWRALDVVIGIIGLGAAVPPLLLLVGVTLSLPPHRVISHYQVRPEDVNGFTWVVVGWALIGIVGAIGALFSRRWGFFLLLCAHAPALLGGWTKADLLLTAWTGSRLLGLGPVRVRLRERCK